MKKTVFFFALLGMNINSFADSSIVADLQEINRLHQYDPLVPFSERLKSINDIKARAEPILRKEFDKLVDGKASPLVCDLLKKPETIGFCQTLLLAQLKTYSTNTQIIVFERVFNATPDSLRGSMIQIVLLHLPREAFGGEEIQQWLVEKINGRMPWGPCYFILTDESARAVLKTATASMKLFSKTNRRKDDRLFSLMSTVFLASRGDESAVALLNALLDQRDINSEVDSGIFAAAMSGNENLIRKIRDIVITDKQTRFMGEDCVPSEISFAHHAAVACALTIEDFPPVRLWDEYDEAIKITVNKWIENNPTYKIKLADPRVFLKDAYQSAFPFVRPDCYTPTEHPLTSHHEEQQIPINHVCSFF